MIGIAMWIGIATLVSGCSFHVKDPFAEGDVMVVGDESGIQALSDMYAAAISEGKAPAGQKGAYYQHREQQTAAKWMVLSVKKQQEAK